jgi:hypothetical protein
MEAGVWLGPEAKIKRSRLIQTESSALIPVYVERSSIPEHIIFDPATTKTSMRSRLAQLGLDSQHNINTVLGAHLQKNGEANGIPLSFINYSQAPILVEKGDIFRLMRRQGPPITGAALIELFANGQIMMGGDEGNDWWIAEDSNRNPIGLGLYIENPEEWIYPSKRPIVPQGATTETFRQEMKKHLHPIKSGDKPNIRISQTTSLFTTPEYMAFIEPIDISVPPPNTRIANPQHLNAPALYGGYPSEPWNIRTETRSTLVEQYTDWKKLPRKAIVVSFYPVINPLPHTA